MWYQWNAIIYKHSTFLDSVHHSHITSQCAKTLHLRCYETSDHCASKHRFTCSGRPTYLPSRLCPRQCFFTSILRRKCRALWAFCGLFWLQLFSCQIQIIFQSIKPEVDFSRRRFQSCYPYSLFMVCWSCLWNNNPFHMWWWQDRYLSQNALWGYSLSQSNNYSSEYEDLSMSYVDESSFCIHFRGGYS